jgi:CheY-like chemotaxis protein
MRPETVLHEAVELVCEQNPRLVLMPYEQMKAAGLELARQIITPNGESSVSVTNKLYYQQKDGCEHDNLQCGKICYMCVEQMVASQMTVARQLALLEAAKSTCGYCAGTDGHESTPVRDCCGDWSHLFTQGNGANRCSANQIWKLIHRNFMRVA